MRSINFWTTSLDPDCGPSLLFLLQTMPFLASSFGSILFSILLWKTICSYQQLQLPVRLAQYLWSKPSHQARGLHLKTYLTFFHEDQKRKKKLPFFSDFETKFLYLYAFNTLKKEIDMKRDIISNSILYFVNNLIIDIISFYRVVTLVQKILVTKYFSSSKKPIIVDW